MKNVNVAEAEMKKVDFSSSGVTTGRSNPERLWGGSKVANNIGKVASGEVE